MLYVITRRDDKGSYVARLGHRRAYTNKLKYARVLKELATAQVIAVPSEAIMRLDPTTNELFPLVESAEYKRQRRIEYAERRK